MVGPSFDTSLLGIIHGGGRTVSEQHSEDTVAAGRVKPRVVLDTNLLVGSAYAEGSASRRIVDACLRGDVIAVLSPALKREYEHVLRRAVRVRGYDEALRRLLGEALSVEPQSTPRVVPEDPEDDKLVAAALAAGADAIVTNDRHLLALDPHGALRILRPAEFVRLRLPA
jgi:putative PIN family toxin of toxin-antitoxin system